MEVTAQKIAELFGIDPISLAGLALLVAGLTQIAKRYIPNLSGVKILIAHAITASLIGVILQHAGFFEWLRLSFCLFAAGMAEWEIIKGAAEKIAGKTT